MKQPVLVIALGAVVLAASAAPSPAEIVTLKDGTRLEGNMRRTDDGWIITDKSNKQTLVTFDRVASIEATVKAGTDVAEQRLASLRRASDTLTDPKQAIERYKAFINQYPGTTAAQKAKVDLAVWQERLDKRLIKIGDKWVSAEEKATIEHDSQGIAADALRLVAQSKLRDATALIDKALVANPRNAAALYLKGVVHYRQDQVPLARKAFEESLAGAPDNIPTMINLAVILWRQNAHPAALAQYDKALLASPADRRILDNLAEALYALPPEQQNAPLNKKISRHFSEQDLALAAKLKLQGLFRWGATWVTAAEMEKLQKADKEIQDKLNGMGVEFDASASRIAQIDSDIAANEKIAKRMEVQSIGMDASGRAVQFPLPASYYDVKRDIAALKSEKATRTAQQEAMRKAAEQLRQQMMGSKYTGMQKLVDVEGTPLPDAPVLAAAALSGAPPPGPFFSPGESPAAPAPGPATSAPAPNPVPAPVAPVTPAPSTPGTPSTPRAPSTTQPARPPVVIPPEKPTGMDRR